MADPTEMDSNVAAHLVERDKRASKENEHQENGWEMSKCAGTVDQTNTIPWRNVPPYGLLVYNASTDQITLRSGRSFARGRSLSRKVFDPATYTGPMPSFNRPNDSSLWALLPSAERGIVSGSTGRSEQATVPLPQASAVFRATSYNPIYPVRLTASNEASSPKLPEVDQPRGNTFFAVGRVFLVLWSEPHASIVRDPDHVAIVNRLGESSYQKVRRFVVVREGRPYCTALSISTHSVRSASKPGEHGIIYNGNSVPSFNTWAATRMGISLQRVSSSVFPISPSKKSQAMSRLGFRSQPLLLFQRHYATWTHEMKGDGVDDVEDKDTGDQGHETARAQGNDEDEDDDDGDPRDHNDEKQGLVIGSLNRHGPIRPPAAFRGWSMSFGRPQRPCDPVMPQARYQSEPSSRQWRHVSAAEGGSSPGLIESYRTYIEVLGGLLAHQSLRLDRKECFKDPLSVANHGATIHSTRTTPARRMLKVAALSAMPVSAHVLSNFGISRGLSLAAKDQELGDPGECYIARKGSIRNHEPDWMACPDPLLLVAAAMGSGTLVLSYFLLNIEDKFQTRIVATCFLLCLVFGFSSPGNLLATSLMVTPWVLYSSLILSDAFHLGRKLRGCGAKIEPQPREKEKPGQDY